MAKFQIVTSLHTHTAVARLPGVSQALWFLPARRYASTGNSDRNVSVRLSVCLSLAGNVSKGRKLAA